MAIAAEWGRLLLGPTMYIHTIVGLIRDIFVLESLRLISDILLLLALHTKLINKVTNCIG